jgi:hypothetical protein
MLLWTFSNLFCTAFDGTCLLIIIGREDFIGIKKGGYMAALFDLMGNLFLFWKIHSKRFFYNFGVSLGGIQQQFFAQEIKLARPYMSRLMVFSLLICPSTGPLLLA